MARFGPGAVLAAAIGLTAPTAAQPPAEPVPVSGMLDLPPLFGDLPAFGITGGPLPVLLDPTTNALTPAPVVVLRNGQRVVIGAPPPPGPPAPTPPVNELLLTPVPSAAAGNPYRLGPIPAYPPAGTHFDRGYRDVVVRVPLYVRGGFQIAQNDAPRPSTRVFTSYRYYDQILAGTNPPDTPRLQLHQELFGAEYAFADRRFSVGVRIPTNQFVGENYLTDSGVGDVTFVGKGVVCEDLLTGDLLSAGMAITVPTGNVPFADTITGRTVHSTLFQPFAGYVLTAGDFYTQGFHAVVVPTDSDDIAAYSLSAASGLVAYRNPGGWVSAVVPVLEMNLNMSLGRRTVRDDPVGFADQFSVQGGLHSVFRDAAVLGVSAGLPVTGPRLYSLQIAVQFSMRL